MERIPASASRVFRPGHGTAPGIVIDLSPLALPACGIRRSVAGLMSELPRCCADAGIRLLGFSYRALQAVRFPGVRCWHLPLPRRVDAMIASLGLIERLTGSALFHATDFYMPLRRRSALVSTVHDVIYAVAPENTAEQRWTERGMRRHVPQAVRAICCSQHSADSLCRHYGYPDEQVDVVPWGIDTGFFSPGAAAGAAPTADQPYFLTVSCNETRKNTPRLVRAFIRYARSGGSYDLRLAWQLPDALRSEVGKAGLAARVHELGKVDDATLVSLYRNTACLLFPSLHEGFGFPVLEALACGTPVMTTWRTSLPEVGGNLPLYVDGMDTDEIAASLHALERGELADWISRCRREGPAWARRFSWQRCAERTVDVYVRALAVVSPRLVRPPVLPGQVLP